jgi:quercetin dioxygenase-like cupin family protein
MIRRWVKYRYNYPHKTPYPGFRQPIFTASHQTTPPAQRLGMVEIIIPANTPGPVAHWHEMHDESFYVTKGTVRFHIPAHPGNPSETHIDAKEGDYITVPIRAPHTFSNPTDSESRCLCAMTPCFYVNYFKLLAQIAEAGKPMTKEANVKAMAVFATLPVEQGGPLA